MYFVTSQIHRRLPHGIFPFIFHDDPSPRCSLRIPRSCIRDAHPWSAPVRNRYLANWNIEPPFCYPHSWSKVEVYPRLGFWVLEAVFKINDLAFLVELPFRVRTTSHPLQLKDYLNQPDILFCVWTCIKPSRDRFVSELTQGRWSGLQVPYLMMAIAETFCQGMRSLLIGKQNTT